MRTWPTASGRIDATSSQSGSVGSERRDSMRSSRSEIVSSRRISDGSLSSGVSWTVASASAIWRIHLSGGSGGGSGAPGRRDMTMSGSPMRSPDASR